MKIRNITETTAGATSSGSVASVAKPLGKMQERTEVSGLHTAEKVMKGKTKKKGPYGNSLSESEFKSKQQVIDYFVKRGKTAQQGAAAWERGWRGTKKSTKPSSDWMARWENDKQERENKLSEAELSEQDLIIVPGMRKIKDTSFIPHKLDRRDHEVEMARSEIYAAAKDAMRIFKLLKDRTEDQGIMGWQQSYITLASDYLNSVADSLDYDANVQEMTGGVLAGGMSNFEEGTSEDNDTIYNNWRKDLGTDYDTTLNLVDKDHNPNKPRNVADELAKMNKKLKGVAEGFEKKDMTGQTCEKCKKDKYQERSWNDDRNGTLQCSCGHVVDRWRKYKKKDKKQGVAEGQNSSPWDQMAHLQSKSNKELDELVRFWQRSLEKNPNHKVANDQLHIIKMIRAERIGRKGVAEGRDNPLQDIDPRGWHLVRGDRPIAINFPDEYTAKSFHSGHGYGRETKILHGSQVRQNAYLQHNPGVINYPKYSKGVAEGSDVEYVVVIRDEHGKRSIRVSALTPTDAKEKAEAQGYKVIKVKDPREAHYFREQSVAETLDINSDSDDAKIEQLKKLLYLDRSHKKEFGSSAGLTQKQLAAARDEIRRLSTGQIQSKSTEKVSEAKCPKCGGPSYQDTKIAEEKDACYHKVKSRYKVWPSAYASGALVKCRKVGASNWGNKSKK